MFNVKTNAIPVIVVETGTVSKLFRKYLSNITGKHEIKVVEKTVILGTAHTLRKVLMEKCKRFNIGNGVICTMNLTIEQMRRYMVCSWYTTVNLLQIVINNNNNNNNNNNINTNNS
jgi:hypothetical protein